ncbi:NAD(P)H-dependent glycerol-3-phosphate dehydrogenase [Clostridium bornimense]|uniref:NAD(P)H-dependent glycerol-3-phosphate dehydrogenase n=1 Tax=Clostridium bornimense TaxID=1216932 RepID=UPI001C0F6CDE|nr:NAD(P)H-dependent glycerol-3-phosphate dehydrogenase [Clostridium bornimense]MBU5317778.1 NAD(P)H-dependent glycerol-3-phosphate dehydrogenase [Clostridium bornimense]
MAVLTFIGGGSFGTALGVHLAKNGHTIKIWDIDEKNIEDINVKRENVKYLPKVMIPFNVIAYNNLEEALRDSKYVFLSVPSHVIRTVCKNIKPYLSSNQVIINMAKGIEDNTFKRLSEVISEELTDNKVAIISGPSHAEEIAQDLPTTFVVSSLDTTVSKEIQEILTTPRIRSYTNDDLVGIEIGGAFKNIIALGCGISDGLGFGDNTKAAIMTRSMNEMIKVGEVLGGKDQTFYGLTGMGDLIVTCTSMHSRNRRAGILIGKGESVDAACKEVGMVVEGVKATKAFYHLAKKYNLSLPITENLYQTLFEGKDVNKAVHDLMSRENKSE